MSKVKIGAGEWVVVCDGARAIILENGGDEKFPNLRVLDHREHKAPRTSDLGADAPGRSIDSAGTRRSAVTQTDWHDQAERNFLEELAGRLDAAVTAGQVKSLIVVAPPRALGMIRPAFTAALRSAVRAEVAKDLVKLPVYEIEKHLTA